MASILTRSLSISTSRLEAQMKDKGSKFEETLLARKSIWWNMCVIDLHIAEILAPDRHNDVMQPN